MAWQWLKHAFAVEGDASPPMTDRQRELVDRVCREVVRRRMTVPALAFLEMSRPLNFLGAQALHFFQPMLSALTEGEGPREFAAFLEHRGSIEHLCRRLEELEREASPPPPGS